MIDGEMERHVFMEVSIRAMITTTQDICFHTNGKTVLRYIRYSSKLFLFHSFFFLCKRSTNRHGVTFVHRVSMTISVFKRSSFKLLLLSGCYIFLNSLLLLDRCIFLWWLVPGAMCWLILDQHPMEKLYQSLKNVFAKWDPGWRSMVKLSTVVFHGNIRMIPSTLTFGKFLSR